MSSVSFLRFPRRLAPAALTVGVLAAALSAHAQNTVFNDAFTTDELHPAVYPSPTPTSTGWVVLANKNVAAPTLADGILTVNMAATSSGFVETQALFAPSAVQLLPGTHIELVATFVPTNINLSGSENLIFGLYNSGGSAPLTGLMNSGLSSSLTTFANGGAKGWIGFNANIPASGNPSMRTRPAQTATTNVVQDVVIGGQSGGSGYTGGLAATNVGTLAAVLTNGSTYTLSYKLALSADSATLTATVALYNDAGTTGLGANSLIGTYSAPFTGANLLTTAFDALAFGWRSNSGQVGNLKFSTVVVKTTGGKPWFTTQPPAGLTASLGSTLTIPAATDGSGTSLQWQVSHNSGSSFTNLDTTANPSAATATLTLANIASGDAAVYRLVATNSLGATTSASTTVIVTTGDVAPAITAQPPARNAVTGGSATFSVTANGTSPLVYRWQKSNDNSLFTDLAGADTATLTLTNIATADAGFYRVIITNSVGTVTSSVATLVVAPVMLTPPVTSIIAPGSAHTLSALVDAGPGAPVATNFQWQRNSTVLADGNGLSGTATATLQFASFTAAQAGYYTLTAFNAAGSVTSAPVYVGVPSPQTPSFLPASNATGIAIDQQLRLVFPSAPKLGQTGTIKIRDAADDSLVATIDRSQFTTFTLFSATIDNALTRSVQGASYFYMPVAIYGNEVWITLPQRLAYGKTYYVTIDPALLLDSNNAAFPGLGGSAAWRFTTKSSGPESPTASTGPTVITVGHDGTGDFATLQAAFDWVPQNNTLPRTVQLRPGVYRDNATLAQNRHFVTISGDAANRTAVQLYYPYPAFSSASGAGTLRIETNDVTVRDLTIDNGVYLAQANGAPAFVGPIQTVQTTGRRLIFNNVLIKGGQDTLYTIRGIAYFYNCEIWGSVDFIYGEALGVFDRCDIVQIRPSGGPVGAPNTPLAQPYGEVFLNCRFPRALVANGYPYDVGIGTTTFMRPWRQDGMTSIINCEIDVHFSTKAWSEWSGSEGEKAVTCRAREFGTTMISGAAAPTIAQRQAAGAYWLNTIDPDYTGLPMEPSNPLVAPGTGTGNRTAVTVNPADYTLEAIFGHPYFELNGWMPPLELGQPPTVTVPPASLSVTVGAAATFRIEAVGTSPLAYQWRKNGAEISGATSATFTIATAQLADAGSYDCVVSNAAGSTSSSAATLTVQTPLAAWAGGFGLDGNATGFATADSDHDGISNLLEFVLGGNPTVADAGLLPSVTFVEQDGSKYLVLEYQRAVAARALPLVVETSADLVNWTARTAGVDAFFTVTPSLGLGLNVDFNNAAGNHYSGAAIAPGDGLIWNSLVNPGSVKTATLPELVDSFGAATTASLSVTSSGTGFSAWSNTTNGTPAPLALMQDYFFGNTYTVRVTSLSAGGYDLYVYAHGDQDNQSSTVTLAATNGGGTRFTAPSGDATFRDTTAANADGIAYVKFTATVPADGALEFSAGNYVNGFQLIQRLDPAIENVRVIVPFTGERLFARLRVEGSN